MGKIEFCGMTQMSLAFDKTEFDGNTILLEIGGKDGKKVICKLLKICFALF